MSFWQIKNFAYGEINERSFSNPHPRDYINIVVEDIVEISSYNPIINVVFIPDKMLQFFKKKVACLCVYHSPGAFFSGKLLEGA